MLLALSILDTASSVGTIWAMRISPEQLITFSVVAEYGSVSKAGELLNLSQPAVSGQLKALQEQVGQPLYLRKARGIVLTPAGEQLLPYAHAIARNVQHVSETIHDLQQRPQRPLKVGFSYALSPLAAPLAVKGEQAGLRLLFSADTSANLVKDVLQADLDAALVVSPIHIPPGQLDTHIIGGDELRLIVPAGHPLGDTGYRSPCVLEEETLLWSTPGSGVRKQAERLLEEAGCVPAKTYELGSLGAVRAGLLGGYGVAILPAGYVSDEVRAGLLLSVGIEAKQTSVTHLLITPPDKVSGPEVRELVRLMKSP